jgi:hypothetical protein
MPNYLFVYYGSGGGEASTPAEQKKMMDAWTGWFAKLGKAVVEMGAPTGSGKTVTKAGARATGQDGVAGYSIIKANNMGAAVNLAKSNPYMSGGMKIGVYPVEKM